MITCDDWKRVAESRLVEIDGLYKTVRKLEWENSALKEMSASSEEVRTLRVENADLRKLVADWSKTYLSDIKDYYAQVVQLRVENAELKTDAARWRFVQEEMPITVQMLLRRMPEEGKL